MNEAPIKPEALSAFQAALESRYRIERELGRGGMAVVYYAHDLVHDRPVAIKVLLPDLAASIGADRFLREIEVGGVLQHPNIVGIYDSGDADGKLYYVMPFVEGASLRDRLDREKQLGIEDALDIVRQVAEGLDFAHSKGIIHRDIKPENILLSGDRALVADFGIARAVTVAGGEKLTQTGMAIGTPTYMSPEQAMGAKDVTAESDIYSLACVLYEMLAGQPPFTGPTALALLARHSLDAVPSLKIVRNTIPDAVEDAIARAMAKVPADRFRTAGAFARALTDHEGAARRRAEQAAQSLANSAKFTAQMPVAEKSGSRKGLLIGVGAAVLLAGGGFAAWKTMGGDAAGGAKVSGPPATEIAVMYFDDRSRDGKLGYLADGLTEALIQELGQIQQLHVISRNGVAQFKGKNVTPDSVSRALNVGTMVTGTVQESQDSLAVRVELIDARTSNVYDTKTIKRPRAESFALQEDLATEVSDFLRTVLGQTVELTGAAGTRNVQAYEAFQRARQQVADAERLLGMGDAEAASKQLVVADSAFQRVEKLDDKWVAPVVEQGWLAYRQSRLLNVFDRQAYAKWIDDGLVHAERAVAMAPGSADAYDLRGQLRYWRWLLNLAPDAASAKQLLAEAEADLNKAVEINPGQAAAWNAISHLRFQTSTISQVKLAALKAYELDPYLTDVNRTVWRLFQVSNDLGDALEANKWCDTGKRRFPDDFRFSECSLWLLTLKTQAKPTAQQIWAAFDAYIKASPANLQDFNRKKGGMVAAIALLRAGLPDSARAVAVRSRAGSDLDAARETVYLEAIMRAQAGDKDDAFRLLDLYLVANPQLRATQGKDDSWWLTDLHDDPRWDALNKS